MGFARTTVGVLFISVLGFYLSTVGQLTDQAKWGFVAAMALLAFLWINLGGRPQPARSNRKPRPQVATPTVESPVPEVEMEEDEGSPFPAQCTFEIVEE